MTIKYVILSAGAGNIPWSLTTKTEWEQLNKLGRYVVSGSLVEEFEANCWCEAMQYFNKKRMVEDYDMHFCKEEFVNGVIPCRFYFEMESRSDED